MTSCDYLIKKEREPISEKAIIEIIQAVMKGNHVLKIPAKGHSMDPLIKDKDIITISPVSKCRIGHGDVVAFIRPSDERLVVHRIVWKYKNIYDIKGDNLNVADRSIPRANIIGKVTKIERRGNDNVICLGRERYFIAFLSRFGILSLFIAALRKVLFLMPRTKGAL